MVAKRYQFSRLRQLVYVAFILLPVVFTLFLLNVGQDSLNTSLTPVHHGSMSLFKTLPSPDGMTIAVFALVAICALMAGKAVEVLFKSTKSYVEIDDKGLTLKEYQKSSSLLWVQVTEVCVDELHGHIELKAGPESLVVPKLFEHWDALLAQTLARLPAPEPAVPSDRMLFVDTAQLGQSIRHLRAKYFPVAALALLIFFCPFRIVTKGTFKYNTRQQWVEWTEVHSVFWAPDPNFKLENVAFIHWPFLSCEMLGLAVLGFLVYRPMRPIPAKGVALDLVESLSRPSPNGRHSD